MNMYIVVIHSYFNNLMTLLFLLSIVVDSSHCLGESPGGLPEPPNGCYYFNLLLSLNIDSILIMSN